MVVVKMNEWEGTPAEVKKERVSLGEVAVASICIVVG